MVVASAEVADELYAVEDLLLSLPLQGYSSEADKCCQH